MTSKLRSLVPLLRKIPFTLAVVAALLVTAVVSGSLWSPLEGRPLLYQVGYGLPALEDGRWWTPLTGMFFALNPPFEYIPVAGGFLLLV